MEPIIPAEIQAKITSYLHSSDLQSAYDGGLALDKLSTIELRTPQWKHQHWLKYRLCLDVIRMIYRNDSNGISHLNQDLV